MNFPEGGDRQARTETSDPLRQSVEAQLLERFAPAHVVVNGEGDILHVSARSETYLKSAQGASSARLLTLARSGLRLALRGALHEAAETRRRIVREAIAYEDDDGNLQFVTLTIEPLAEPLAERHDGEPLFLVLFEPRSDGQRSANAELRSSNEELKTSNAELKTSNDDMQFLNEELNTINADLISRMEIQDRAHSDLKDLSEGTRIATIFLDARLEIRSFTPAAEAFFDLSLADVGRPLTDLETRLDYPRLQEHIAQVFTSGRMIEHQLSRNEAGVHYLVHLIPYRDGTGTMAGVVVTFVDVTTLANAEEHQRVLIAELNHRVKNMLAVTASIARQTLKSAPSPEHFAEALLGRLHAMERSYSVLSREKWTAASAEEIVRQEVEPFGLERVSLSGGDISLKPQEGLSLGMVIHELATNAAKYGALSAAGGLLSVAWSVRDRKFHLEWTESGRPSASAPARSGFGMTLVKGEVEYRLGGIVETSFGPGGLSLRLAFPLDRRENERG